MKFSIILFSSIVLFACSQQPKQADAHVPQIPTDWTLKEHILEGNTTAYLELYHRYYQKDNAVDFFPWAVIMANKYRYKRAYRDAHACLLATNSYYGKRNSVTSNNSNVLDSATINLAKEMLYKTFDTALIRQELVSTERLYKK
jgi:hypothetical protein